MNGLEALFSLLTQLQSLVHKLYFWLLTSHTVALHRSCILYSYNNIHIIYILDYVKSLNFVCIQL